MDGNRGAKGSIKDRLISMLYRIRYAKKVKKEEEERVREILVKGMKEAARLSVELEVDVHSGMDWYEAK